MVMLIWLPLKVKHQIFFSYLSLHDIPFQAVKFIESSPY